MPSTPLEKFLKWEREIPGNVFLRQPINGKWITWTWEQAGNEARRLANGFKSLGIKKGDHIALLSKNCAQWVISDIAIMMAGCISVPVYPTLSDHSIEPILIHSDSKAIIIGKLDDYSNQEKGIPQHLIKIGINIYGRNEEYSYEEIVQSNDPIKDLYQWQQDDIMTIIYTSGTTGKSKGVMHKVRAFDAVLNVAIPQLQIPMNPVLISYLPLSHIAERVGIEMVAIYTRGAISFAESIELFAKNMLEIQPQLFFAVPRIWGKIREGILSKMSQKKLNFLLAIPGIRAIIKKGIKKKLGFLRVSHFYSAAAPISVELQEWYEKIGITIYQAYGMTEDCVYSHFCTPKAQKFGTVGKALSGLRVKIAEDGEIRVKSEGNMVGYYKESTMTAEVFDGEGYFKTGDMGEYDEEGYLKITGRVKDQFKTDKGKYISPAPIEIMLLKCPEIEYCCVVGTGVPQPMVLICLSDSAKRKSKESLINEFSEIINKINPGLEKYERLEKVVIMKENWTVANNLITPSLKVKRNEVEKIHLPNYPTWYGKEGCIIWE